MVQLLTSFYQNKLFKNTNNFSLILIRITDSLHGRSANRKKVQLKGETERPNLKVLVLCLESVHAASLLR